MKDIALIIAGGLIALLIWAKLPDWPAVNVIIQPNDMHITVPGVRIIGPFFRWPWQRVYYDSPLP